MKVQINQYDRQRLVIDTARVADDDQYINTTERAFVIVNMLEREFNYLLREQERQSRFVSDPWLKAYVERNVKPTSEFVKTSGLSNPTIAAIKHIRQVFGCGLSEAKRAFDEVYNSHQFNEDVRLNANDLDALRRKLIAEPQDKQPVMDCDASEFN